MELKEPEEAIAAFRKSAELEPNRADTHYYLGVLLRQQIKPDEALLSFRKCIEVNPRHAAAHGHSGSILAIQGKEEEGIAAFQKAIELNPNQAGSHTELAWILATAADPKLRDSKAAVSHARQATELRPDVPNHWRNLGAALLRDGDYQAAVEALEKFPKMTNDKQHQHGFFLAMAYWQIGEKDKANQAYDEAVEWMEKNAPKSGPLRRFRAEAAELLERNDEKSKSTNAK